MLILCVSLQPVCIAISLLEGRILGILFRPPKGGRNIFHIRLSSKKYKKLIFEAQKAKKYPK